MPAIWNNIVNRLLIIKEGTGNFWMPPQTGSLSSWNVLNGYQIYMTASGNPFDNRCKSTRKRANPDEQCRLVYGIILADNANASSISLIVDSQQACDS